MTIINNFAGRYYHIAVHLHLLNVKYFHIATMNVIEVAYHRGQVLDLSYSIMP